MISKIKSFKRYNLFELFMISFTLMPEYCMKLFNDIVKGIKIYQYHCKLIQINKEELNLFLKNIKIIVNLIVWI